MGNYYKFYENDRFRHITECKLKLHNRTAKIHFYFFFILSLLFIFILPTLQLVYWYTHPGTNLIREYGEYWKIKIYYFLIIGFFTSIISFLSSFGISGKLRVTDELKKTGLFTPNLIRIGSLFIFSLIINFLSHYLYEIIMEVKLMGEIQDNSLRRSFICISVAMYTSFIFWIMGLFIFCLKTIESDLKYLKDLEKIKKESYISKYKYIYWIYFQKNLVLNQPLSLIGAILFIILTCISFLIQGGDLTFFRIHFILSVAFYSFWIASVNLTLGPIFNAIRNLSSQYNQYSLHIIRNSILPNLKDHVIIIGARNLGRQIIRNCFSYIHPEGYGAKSICMVNDEFINKKIKTVSDYDIIIDKNLDIYTISRRIVVIDRDSELFKERYEDMGDISLAIYEPWNDETIHMGLIGICGDAFNEYILNAVAVKRCEVLINATPTFNLSLHLNSKYPDLKQLLNVNDSYTFDTLIANTYHKAIYIIDTQTTEGINLSQLIFHWAYKNVRNNIKQNNLPIKIEDFRKDINFNKYKEKYFNNRDEIQDEEIIKGLLKSYTVMKGNGRILLVGSGSYTYHIIKFLWLSMKFEMGIKDDIIKDVLQNKLFLLSDDERINNECIEGLKLNSNSTIWKFYPIRNKITNLDDAINIRLFKGSCKNFERFIEVLTSYTLNNVNILSDSLLEYFIQSKKNNDVHHLLPELIVLINASAYTSIDMLVSASTAAEIIDKSIRVGKIRVNEKTTVKGYKPQILVYSNRSDKVYLNEQFKKYFTFNLNREEKIGYPSQLPKESRLTKDWVGAFQYSSMLKALYVRKSERPKKAYEEPVAEVTFSVIDKPGIVACTAAAMNGRELVHNNNNKTLVPSFINYFSAEEVRYKDTFLFKGLAKLCLREKLEFNDIVRYYYVNCKNNALKNVVETLNNNIECKHKSIEYKYLISKDNSDPGMFTHYPVSSILRHPDIFNDIVNIDKRLFIIRSDKTDIMQVDNYTDIRMLFNIADVTIWAQGENTSGTLAEVLSQIILAKTEKKNNLKYNKYEPLILFSNNRPPIETESNEKCNKFQLAQDSFYIKLRYKKSNDDLYKLINNGLIRALKIKLSSEIIIDENLHWSEYLFKLENHLNSFINVKLKYTIYVIEKCFIEGYFNQSNEDITEICRYKKITVVNNNLEIDEEPVFTIIKRWKILRGKYRELPELIFKYCDKIKELVKLGKTQRYEFVVIRNDIVERAEIEKNKKEEFGTFQNMIFFIEDQ